MESKLTFKYDREGDILYIISCRNQPLFSKRELTRAGLDGSTLVIQVTFGQQPVDLDFIRSAQ